MQRLKRGRSGAMGKGSARTRCVPGRQDPRPERFCDGGRCIVGARWTVRKAYGTLLHTDPSETRHSNPQRSRP
eukprot:2648837-Prymnesium_polylepis.1